MDEYELMLQMQQEDSMRDGEDVPEPGPPHVRLLDGPRLYDQDLEPETPASASSAWEPETITTWLVQFRYTDPRMERGWHDLGSFVTRAEALGLVLSQPLDQTIGKEMRVALLTTQLTPVALG